MNDTLHVALVAGGAALLGSLIPTIVGYLNNKAQREFEIKKALCDRQSQIYSELMLSLQKIINTQSKASFFELQKTVMLVSI